MRTFLDKEVQSGHDDFDILPDQGVILFDDNLVQNQVKQQHQLIEGNNRQKWSGESDVAELEYV